MITMGIIGTAGRQTDGPKLTKAHFDRMCWMAEQVINIRNVTHLVSGGAAWADHVAVVVALRGCIAPTNLTLHLPAQIGPKGFFGSRDAEVSNHYHLMFGGKVGRDPFADILMVSLNGCHHHVNLGGFKARNSDVARDAKDILLAFTFGSGVPWKAIPHGPETSAAEAGLKDGGTADTWNKCRGSEKIHVCLA